MGLHHGQANFVTYGKPSLFLDFANKKSLVDRISGNNLITFTRSSIGTYVGADGLIKYAAADEPRFDHDPVTGESLGLLIEEARTNLYDNTTNYGSSNWALQTSPEVTLNTTDVLSPDGTYNAVKWTPTTTLSQYVYDEVGNRGSSLTHTMSVWVRTPSGESTTFQMNLFSPTQLSPIFTATDTWRRFTWTFIPQSQSSAYPVIVRELNKSLYIWGPQIEVGSFATSYIPTDASTVTRQVDYPRITGTNFSSWFNNSQGSVITDMSGTKSSFGGNFGISFGSSGTNYIAYPYIQSNGTISNSAFFIIENGTYINFPNGSVPHTYGFSYGSGSTPLYGAYDGISQPPDPIENSYISTDFDSLRIGLSHFAPGEHQNFHLKKLIYYPQQFITSQLQSLTQ